MARISPAKPARRSRRAILKPRPSVKAGNSTAYRLTRSFRARICSRSSSPFTFTPVSRVARASACSSQRASGSTTGPVSGRGWSSVGHCQRSSMTGVRSMISAIYGLLEGGYTHTAYQFEETFLFGFTQLDVGQQKLFDGVGHLVSGNRLAQGLAQRRIRFGGAAQGKLIPVFAL